MSDSRIAISRLSKEAKMLSQTKIHNVYIKPNPKNIFEWIFVLYGLPQPYEKGIYLGKILFPLKYPFKPPDIVFMTPNGRFEINKKICLSFTSYHPESWSNWSIEGILVGLVSFMLQNDPTTGAVMTSSRTKRRLAFESLAYNLRQPLFVENFKDKYSELNITADDIELRQQKLKASEVQSYSIVLAVLITIILLLALTRFLF